jgi:hypothetical protein
MSLLLLFSSSARPIFPATIDTGEEVPGPDGLGTDQHTIFPAAIESGEEVPGPKPRPDPLLRQPIRPQTIGGGELVGGPTILRADALPPTIPAGPATISTAITVPGYPLATAIQAQPKLNDVGAGSFTTVRPGPAVDEIVGVNVGTQRVFTGLSSRITDVRLAKGEEAEQLISVELDGLLAEWQRVLVLPDFGAQDVGLLGPPTQDTRVFDWTMNGLGTDDPDDLPEPKLLRSVALTNAYGTSAEVFPLPDVWPAPYARWMWVRDPRLDQPRGFCHFRIPFGVPRDSSRKIQVWCCAYDQADVWLDGVPLLVCDTPGAAQRFELTVTRTFHNLTIRAYNDKGKAGLLVAIMPVDEAGLYGRPLRLSGGGWKCLAYPSRTFRLNPGQVLRRLHLEARRRNAAFVPEWKFSFTASHDSAGRPWPANDEISVQVGGSMFDVLRQLSESLVDFAAAPGGRLLHMWVKDQGTGTSHPNPWTAGVDLTSRTIRRVTR